MRSIRILALMNIFFFLPLDLFKSNGLKKYVTWTHIYIYKTDFKEVKIFECHLENERNNI